MRTLPEGQEHAGDADPRRLFVFNGGFLWQKRVRRILQLSGYDVRLGKPDADALVGVWGQSPTSHRGEAVAAHHSNTIVRVEDAFLRSLFPGRSGEPPLGLLIDHNGVHFDGNAPSDLETLLATASLDDAALLNRARAAIARLKDAHLSKYCATLPEADIPAPGYVLVVDQTQGDASVSASNADRSRFLEMLTYARQEHPGQRFILKTHPETSAGHRGGHFTDADAEGQISIYDGPASPWALLEGAIAVYTVSSQMGFEAILAGHKPRVFGKPFYAGWGLTEDEEHFPRRGRALSRAQLFAAAMMLYPKWYDPFQDRLCTIEDVIGTLEAQSRAWRADHAGWVASGMRLWKRKPLQKFFGAYKAMRFEDDVEKAQALAADTQANHMSWAGKAGPNTVRIEDGFLRSRGLGAELTPPLSLVADRSGIYYDPSAPSDLETIIQRRATNLRPDQSERAEKLIQHITSGKLSKYNLSGGLPPLPQPHLILVPGQVEDDASILRGCSEIATNDALLRETRSQNPEATLVYKPHPDVEAGLRTGHVENAGDYADIIIQNGDIADLLDRIDEVWTMTSLTGFEALLRGVKTTCLGAPFYAGWGLTKDLGDIPDRRLQGPRPSLAALVHATLIDYPRYWDPVTGQACPVEVIIDRLENDDLPRPGMLNRTLSKLQGLFASQSHIWRT